MKDLAVAFFLLVGTLFSLVAAIGILRFPDVFTRMHASAKSGTLGGGCLLLAVILHFMDRHITIEVGLIIVFFVLTAPVGTHILGRASYLTKEPLWKKSVLDEPRATNSRHPFGGSDSNSKKPSSK